MNSDDIVADHIRAVAAIHVSSMFDAMKAYDAADRLVELYLTGFLPVSRSDGRRLLYEYWRHAPDGMTATERRGVYARTIGRPGGDGGEDEGGESNREFHDLWLRFVGRVSELARQPAADSPPDTGPGQNDRLASGQDEVRARARDLASNVSAHGKKAGVTAIAIDKQLRMLIELLSDQEIQAAYSARDLWQVVDRVASLELGGSRSGVRYRTMAESGAVVFAWLASRPPDVWTGDADALDLNNVAAKRRSDNARTKPSDYDLVEACEQWLTNAGGAGDSDDSGSDGVIDDAAPRIGSRVTRDAVGALTSRSAAYAQMPAVTQARIARDTVRVVEYLAAMESPEAFAQLIDAVDFPQFVVELINGVFAAIVDVSVQQMEAYADLIAAVAALVDQFRAGHVSETELLAHLYKAYPALCERGIAASRPSSPDYDRSRNPLDTLAGGLWRRLASSRQQLLANVIILGLRHDARSD
jgi:hypothetical protein